MWELIELYVYAILGFTFHIIMQYYYWWWFPLMFILLIPILFIWREICLHNQKQDYLDYQLFCSLQHCSDCPYRVALENTM